MSTKLFLILTLIFCITLSLDLLHDEQQQNHDSFAASFCWKKTYGRGIGKVPSKCQSGRVKIGLLCYTKCPSGMKRYGFDCHSTCPTQSGWRDDGLFCRKTQYGRGVGYGHNEEINHDSEELNHDNEELNHDNQELSHDKSAKKKCQKKHKSCEKWGLLWYPKCKSGYSAFGCCICRPKSFKCSSYGLKNGIDLSCAKKIKIGDPVSGKCSSNQDKDGGLCYKKCKKNYKGVGPVCWGQKPKSSWVNCGLGASKSSTYCASVVFEQVTSVGMVALNVASLGTSMGVTKGVSASKQGGKAAQLLKKFKDLQKKMQESQKIQKLIKLGKNANNAKNYGWIAYLSGDMMTTDPQKVTVEDIVRYVASLAALVDPSGIAATVAAYTYPTCDKI